MNMGNSTIAIAEDEARRKWCPFGPTHHKPGSSHAGAPEVDDLKSASRCIAGACMAWRWSEPWTSSTEEGHGGDLVLRLSRKPGDPMVGFCGLAGQPTP
jgi:hypothetical protein